jgi:hypothetical protein
VDSHPLPPCLALLIEKSAQTEFVAPVVSISGWKKTDGGIMSGMALAEVPQITSHLHGSLFPRESLGPRV